MRGRTLTRRVVIALSVSYHRTYVFIRSLIAAWILLALTCWNTAAAANAGPSKLECVEASGSGQEERDAGKLIDARRSFRICAAASCPDVVREACAEWLDAVEERIPSIVVVARKKDGSDARIKEVRVDGTAIAELSQGRAVDFDPGKHSLEVDAEGETKALDLVIREGESERQVVIDFAPPPEETPDVQARPFPWVPVLATTGGVFLGTSIALGISVQTEADSLREDCAPSCEDGKVDPLRGRLLLAEVALGVSVASFATATVLYFVQRKSKKAESAVRWTPVAAPHQVGMSLEGRF